jgi:hypothetical protein
MIGFSKRSSVIAIDSQCGSSRSELFDMTITVMEVEISGRLAERL